jgi:hypothetical protein
MTGSSRTTRKLVRSLLHGRQRFTTVVGKIIRFTAFILPLTALAGTVGAKDNVEIRLSGHFFAEPATVQMIIAVEPNSENRTLRVEADGDNMFCSTEVTLAGDNEKRLHTIQFKNLAAGEYTLRAQVLSNSSVRSQAEQAIMVTGDGN